MKDQVADQFTRQDVIEFMGFFVTVILAWSVMLFTYAPQ